MNEAKTISELSNIDGAFNEGNVYECVYVCHRWFTVGAYYECDGCSIIDNNGVSLPFGNRSTFKLVTPKEEAKTMRTPFNLERALAGDKVVDKNDCEYSQFRVIKMRLNDVISYYSIDGDYLFQNSESTANTILFMTPKMGKGFVNVDADEDVMGYETKKEADRFASSDRIMCIDLSQLPEGYGL